MEPGPRSTRCSATPLEVLRIVAVLVSPAMPATAAEIWRRIGVRRRPRRARLPGDAAWGGYPGGAAVVQGRPALPAAQGLELTCAGWFDAHCHVQEEYHAAMAPRRAACARCWSRARRRPASTGWSASGPGVATSARRSTVARATSTAPVRRRTAAWASVGLHPHEASEGVDEVAALLAASSTRATARSSRSGECGLDYYYEHSPRDAQREAFARRSRSRTRTTSRWSSTPATPGTTSSTSSTAEGVPERPCCTASPAGADEVERCLRAGMYVSFSGIVTFKNADDVRAAAERCPLDRLLVETDSPFLAPVPHRGRTNEPAFLPLVGAAVAAVKGCTVDELKNARPRRPPRCFATGT